jgi:hypothetical protein
MSRNKLYSLLAISCLAGYTWLGINYWGFKSADSTIEMCIIKQATGIPCPSCGSTRSVEALLHGNVLEALKWNPLGFLLFVLLIILPIWIVFDVIGSKKSLHGFFKKSEKFLNKRLIAVIAVLLLLANWIWNIEKGL